MKDEKLDELFREKFTNNKIEAPSNAWEQIEANLDTPSQNRKKGIWIWLSVAASISLIAAVSWVSLGNQNVSDNTFEQQAKVETPKQETAEKQEIIKEVQPQPIEESTPVASLVKKDPAKIKIERNPEEVEESIIQEETRKVFIASKIKPRKLLKNSPFIEGFKYEMNAFQLRETFQAYLDSQPEIRIEESKRKFSLLGGIVSVAKEVNSKKLGFTDIRKSKNEFVNKDLKYGDNAIDDTPKDR